MADQGINVVSPLLPECANNYLSEKDVNYDSGAGFRPNTVSYYEGVLTSTVPGLVLGACSLVAMIVLIIWTCISFCRCFRLTKRRRKDEDHDQESDQFISAQSGNNNAMLPPGMMEEPNSSHKASVNPAYLSNFDYLKSYPDNTKNINSALDAKFGLPKELTCTERFRVKGILKVSIIIMMLATVGVASWGIAESVKRTESLVPGFWDLYENVQDVAKQVNGILARLQVLIGESEPVLATIMRYEDQILNLVSSPGFESVQSLARDGLDVVGQTKGALSDIKGPITTAAEISNETFVQGMQSFRDSLETPTLAFQEYGRFIAIAVMFGMVILFSLVGGLLAVWGRFPRLVSTAIILLWLFVALLMLLGVGLLSGVNYVTKDGCLYAETFVVNYANDYIAPEAKAYAMRAIDYYVNPEYPTEYIPGEALQTIIDPSAAALLAIYQDAQSEFDQFLDLIPVVSSSNLLDSDLRQALNTVGTTITEVNSILSDIDKVASRQNVYGIYYNTKEYICCTLHDDLRALFDAWVATGCISLVLAILCSWRLIWFVREKYPYTDPS